MKRCRPAGTFYKDPDATLDYRVDWSSALGKIVASDWSVGPGLVVGSESFDDTGATIWLSGGTDGVDYPVTNHATDSAGREDDQTLIIKVRET